MLQHYHVARCIFFFSPFPFSLSLCLCYLSYDISLALYICYLSYDISLSLYLCYLSSDISLSLYLSLSTIFPLVLSFFLLLFHVLLFPRFHQPCMPLSPFLHHLSNFSINFLTPFLNFKNMFKKLIREIKGLIKL